MTAVQLGLTHAAALPAPFVSRWREIEEEAHRLRSDIRRRDVLEADEVIRFGGQWWIALRVNGRRYAVCARACPRRAAEDLFAMVHG